MKKDEEFQRTSPRRGEAISILRIIIASTFMFLTFFCLRYMSHGENIEPNKSFSTFPKQMGDWVGEEKYFDQRIYDKLGVDDSIICSYRNQDGHTIELYIGFYQRQRQGVLIHSPKNCMPGAGWNFVKTRKAAINIGNPNHKTIVVNNILLQKGSKKEIMFYWFQGRGRFLTSEYAQKIYLVLDSITKRRTDEAFVRIISPVFKEDEESTLKHLENFTKLLIPLLQEYLPS